MQTAPTELIFYADSPLPSWNNVIYNLDNQKQNKAYRIFDLVNTPPGLPDLFDGGSFHRVHLQHVFQ